MVLTRDVQQETKQQRRCRQNAEYDAWWKVLQSLSSDVYKDAHDVARCNLCEKVFDANAEAKKSLSLHREKSCWSWCRSRFLEAYGAKVKEEANGNLKCLQCNKCVSIEVDPVATWTSHANTPAHKKVVDGEAWLSTAVPFVAAAAQKSESEAPATPESRHNAYGRGQALLLQASGFSEATDEDTDGDIANRLRQAQTRSKSPAELKFLQEARTFVLAKQEPYSGKQTVDGWLKWRLAAAGRERSRSRTRSARPARLLTRKSRVAVSSSSCNTKPLHLEPPVKEEVLKAPVAKVQLPKAPPRRTRQEESAPRKKFQCRLVHHVAECDLD